MIWSLFVWAPIGNAAGPPRCTVDFRSYDDWIEPGNCSRDPPQSGRVAGGGRAARLCVCDRLFDPRRRLVRQNHAAGSSGLEFVLALVAAAIALPCGILAFGANVAVPLSWAALTNERDPDPLDSLSRGYEYLFRRPLRLRTVLGRLSWHPRGGRGFWPRASPGLPRRSSPSCWI